MFGKEGWRLVMKDPFLEVRVRNYLDSFRHPQRDGFEIVAFPRSKIDAKAFREAVERTTPGGPSGRNPGAVGTVCVYLREPKDIVSLEELREKGITSALFLAFAQAHFKTGRSKGKGSRKGRGFLPWSLAAKYYGWRQHCLRTAILFAQKTGRHFIIDKESESLKRFLDLNKKAHSSKTSTRFVANLGYQLLKEAKDF